MNKGKSLQVLVSELNRQAKVSVDYLADTNKIQMLDNTNIVLDGQNMPYNLTKHAHSQLATWAKIPQKYYQHMQTQSPELLATNVNHWLQSTENQSRRLVRTLDGKMRAFLSSKYRRIDNLQIAEAILPSMLNSEHVEIVSCDITDDRLYIKALFPKIQGDVVVGDTIQAGIVISNTETGNGRLYVMPLIYRLVCTNGLSINDAKSFGLSQMHVGRQLSADELNYEIYSNETILADDRALMLKLRDAVSATANEVVFHTILNRMRDAKQSKPIKNPVKAVEVLASHYALKDTEKDSFLMTLIRDRDYSQYGAVNAVTEIANTLNDYERSTELEFLGGELLNAPKRIWNDIAEAA